MAGYERPAPTIEGRVAMNPNKIIQQLLAVLAGIPEDGGNYRTRREAITLANQLAKALDGAK
jgi:hypothetical protein